MTAGERPIAILVAALGGQGGGVLGEWLVDASMRAGYPVQSTSIPGVAQRTGATSYYIEVFPRRHDELGGREPVLSLAPAPGGVDVLIASELLEAARIVQGGATSAERTVAIVSSSRTLTTIEKIPLGDGRFDSDRLRDAVRAHSRRFVSFDMDEAARDAGTAVSAVMFGALAASGVLPFGRDACEAAIDAKDVASARGFARGFDATAGDAARAKLPPTAAADVTDRESAASATPDPDAAAALAPFPPSCRAILAAGCERLVEFQDARYAQRYLERLAVVRDAERDADPSGERGFATTRETARFLALWMAFDDIVRVAQLKSRASRHARVRREVAAGDADVVRVFDFFKPGVPEIAGLLPARPARALVAWDRRRQRRGRRPFAIALRLRTDGVAGLLALRALAALRPLRPRTSRFAEEQAAIERWLAAVVAALRVDWQCAFELALCGRLIKGYGDTNARGKDNLAHIVDHLAVGGAFATPAQRAAAIRDAREAALADEGGRGLDATLVRHGAPPRPVVAKPVVWMNRRERQKAMQR